jgi:hypothetical protein
MKAGRRTRRRRRMWIRLVLVALVTRVVFKLVTVLAKLDLTTPKQKLLFAYKALRGLRVCIIMYGVDRSLEFTHESIERNILGQLRAHRAHVDIFYRRVHISGTFTNLRTGENSTSLTNYAWDVPGLRASYVNQSDIQRYNESYFRSVLAYGDAWNTEYVTPMNMLVALTSLKQAFALATRAKTYDGVRMVPHPRGVVHLLGEYRPFIFVTKP